MAYCLNPVCPQPQNRADAKFCLSCGSPLLLAKKYQPESLLGKGGFGRTLLARTVVGEGQGAEPAGTRCVIKQIYRTPAETNAAFNAEAERLEQLGKHPQIPRLLASVENSLGQFLVQEFAPGENLEALVARDGAWDEDEVRSLLNSLVAVLQYVHSFKVIHRDIKPANIVQGKDAGQASLMLVDFGAAKWIGQTVGKTVIGSAGYAAPEQSMGQATFASDIYSLGLTCLHLLTGLHPFELYSAAEDRWVWQDYLPTPVSPQLVQVLDKMVVRSLQTRYATMAEVATDLKAAKRFQLSGARQLLERAKDSVLPLQSVLEGGSLTAALQKLAPGQSAKPPALAPVIIDRQHWSVHRRIAVKMGLTQSITVSPSAPMFATASSDGAIRLWDLADGSLIYTFARRRLRGEGHSAAVTNVQFHPDGRALYSASDDGSVKEWDALEHQLMNTLPSKGWTPTALAVSPDGTTLISANSDGRIALWDIASLSVVGQLTQHQTRVNALAISKAGHLLASAGEDDTVRLWRYSSGQMPQMAKVIRLESTTSALKGFGSFSNDRHGVRAIALQDSTHSDPPYLVTATCNTVWRYELTSQFEVRNATALYSSENAIRAIALSQKGLLAVGTEDRVLTLWQLSTGNCVGELKHDWGISAIAFSLNGKMLITASADETLFIWRIENSELGSS